MNIMENDFNKINLNDKGQFSIYEPLLTEQPKSLKEKHFANYCNNIFKKSYKTNNLKTISITENNQSKINFLNENEISSRRLFIQTQIDNKFIHKNIFKNPRRINYKLLKYNPCKTHFKSKFFPEIENLKNISNMIKTKNKYKSEKNMINNKTVTLYNLQFKKIKEKKDKYENKRKSANNENKNKPNFFHKKEYNNIVNKIKAYKDSDKSNKLKAKKYYDNNIREGYYGKKNTFGIPFFYDTSTIFKNEYSNKSEKSRHQLLQNELNKLKTYLIREPDKKLYLIKDFLIKFHLDKIENYSDEQFLNLANYISNVDANTLSNNLKPYLNIKNMIYDILNNSLNLNNSYLEEKNQIENKQNDENNKEKDNINNNEEIINNETNNNISKKSEIPKKNITNEEKYYLSPLITPERLRKIIQYNKFKEIYNNNSEILNNNSKTCYNVDDNNNNINSNKFDLYLTNSKLKYMKYQIKTLFPEKNYKNNRILVKEIGKEIKELENDFNEKLKELELMKSSENKKRKNSFNFSLHKPKSINIEIKDKLYMNVKKKNKTRLNILIPIHYNFTKNYNGEIKDLNEIMSDSGNKLLNSENSLYREKLLSMDNCCLNSTDRNSKDNIILGNNNLSQRDSLGTYYKIKKEKISDAEIIKRLYYIPTRKKFGLQEIRNRLKLTEYIALTNAKNNIYKNGIINVEGEQKNKL